MSLHRRLTIGPTGKDFWGPPTWTFMHILAYHVDSVGGRDKELRDAYNRLWSLLVYLIPCDICRDNLRAKLVSMPVQRLSTSSEFELAYIIHDMANVHISKHTSQRKVSPSYRAVYAEYSRRMEDGYEFWGPYMWSVIHTFGATLSAHSSEYFTDFLLLLPKVIPSRGNRLNDALMAVPPMPYMKNNNDAFYYTYLLQKRFDELSAVKGPEFIELKTLYFRSLGEECSQCKL